MTARVSFGLQRGCRPRLGRAVCLATAFAALGAGTPSVPRAQDIEPRACSNAPVGVNFLVAGHAYTRGGVAFDSSVPVSNPQLTTSSAVLGYGRMLEFWGQSAKLNVIVPVSDLHGTAEHAGSSVQRTVSGFADPIFKSTLLERMSCALITRRTGYWPRQCC